MRAPANPAIEGMPRAVRVAGAPAVIPVGQALQAATESDGSPGQSVAEWYQKLELVCRLRGVEDVACVVRLRLIDGAFAVYLEIPEEGKESAAKVKEALMSAFSADLSAAYDEFTTRQLRAGEAPDMFLAELRRLASLFGGISVVNKPAPFLLIRAPKARHMHLRYLIRAFRKRPAHLRRIIRALKQCHVQRQGGRCVATIPIRWATSCCGRCGLVT
ncbi:hypothetical protein M513_08796 [Trichuris suis]|uniref:Retrotransposon gag domain-containing protein n=1 Tax=Trichuris suis TaxID=68888 RepID=A0A085LZA0_9BILA|nr:hypothetical protein M513_08796 [Trichuris suis]